MASNYWKVDDVEQIGERQIEIPSENGLSYTSGQKISLFIPPSVEVMDGQNTYLNFDLKLSMPAGKKPTRLQLDECGGGIIFKNLRIYDGTRGNLLEELNEYSSLVALKHSYDADESLRATRALTEGGTSYNQNNRGTKGSSKPAYADTLTNPYFRRIDTPVEITPANAPTELFTTAKCCVPIHSGIFSGSVFPVMMSSGLYLEFDLEPAPRVIKQLDSVLESRRLTLNPVIHGIDAAATTWGNTVATTELFISKLNNLSGTYALSKFPFVVGENFDLIKTNLFHNQSLFDKLHNKLSIIFLPCIFRPHVIFFN